MWPFFYVVLRWRIQLVRLALLPVSIGLTGLDSRAQTLHAIMVANTKDPVLARACAYDMEVMHRQLFQIATAIDYELKEHIISDKDFGLKQLDRTLQSVAPRPDDILLFYYTGHGYNLSSRASADPYPILNLEKKGQNPGLRSIHAQLKRKNARLCITLGDCCNNIASGIRGQPNKRVLPKPLMLTNDSLNATYRRLFLGFSGDVLIASSKPPQTSVAHPDSGSFYTRAFDEALDLSSKRQTRSWASLLQTAQTQLARHAPTRTRRSLYESNVNTNEDLTKLANTLTISLRTDRGRQNVTYEAGDQIQLEAKASRPCHIRLIYLMADDGKMLLADDFVIKPGQANQFVRLRPQEEFPCTEPFGEEHLLIFASDVPFCPIPTKPNPILYKRNEDGNNLLVGSYAAMIEGVKCTVTPTTVVEDRVRITTRDKLAGKQ